MRNSITYQLSNTQYTILGELLNTSATYNVLNAGRQSGKTFLSSRLAVILAIIQGNEKSKILIAAPYNSQVDTFFENVLMIEGVYDFITKVSQSPYKSIKFKNGSVMHFRSVDNPKSIRSKSYDYIFLDEFAFFKEDAFNLVIVPTLIASGSDCKIYFTSTPNGISGEYYDFAQSGKDKDKPDYSYQHMTYLANPNRNQKLIDSEEQRMPPKQFEQEFLGEFKSDGGDVFTGLDKVCILIVYATHITMHRYFAGIDFGKVNDKTVLTIFDQDRNVVFCQSYSGDWNKQVNDIGLILNEYKPLTYAESNGPGDAVIANFKSVYPGIKPFITSNSSKKDIIEDLRMTIVKEEIGLPTRKLNPTLFKEMSNFTYSITKTGLISYHHRPNEHDDYVDSLAIANHCYKNHNKGFGKVLMNNRSNFYN